MIRVQKVSERQRLDNLLAEQEVKIGSTFLRFVDQFKSEKVLKELNDAIEANDFAKINQIIDGFVITFANVFPTVFATVAAVEADRLIEQLGPMAIAVGFDPTYPRAAERARQGRFDLLRGLTLQQRQATQQAIAAAFESGYAPRQVARAIVNSIGLTAQQEQAVRSYRSLLEKNSKEALSRQMRDRRFDRKVTGAVDNDVPLTSAEVDRMVDAYRKNAVNMRALTIARTQGQRAMNEARSEVLEQVMEPLSETHVAFKTWFPTHDSRTRDHHASMAGQRVRFDQPFVDGKGNLIRYPGDPLAPADTTVNCRCGFTVEIRLIEDA